MLPPLFVLIEMDGLDISSVRATRDKHIAVIWFDKCCEENQITPDKNLGNEAPGTVCFAGDDAYAVQLLEIEQY